MSRSRLALVGSFAFAVIILSGCAAGTYSSLTLAPGERFTLGGEGDGAFRVELRNEGGAPVELSEQTASGALPPLGTLEPGASRSAQFAAGSAAVLTNRSDVEARVAAEIRGGGDLGMRTSAAQ